MGEREAMTTSLSLSQALHKAGLVMETEKWWYQQVGGIVCDTDVRGEWIIRYTNERDKGFGRYIPAPSTDELLAVLPAGIVVEIWRANGMPNNYHINYPVYGKYFNDLSPAEALGQMCLWLLQNGWEYDKEKKCLTQTR